MKLSKLCLLTMATFSLADLTAWAKQGVLLLNATLTIYAGQPNSMSNIGRQQFTDEELWFCFSFYCHFY